MPTLDAKLDQERKAVSQRLEKFEGAVHEIHDMADRIHKKMKKIHLEASAIRERARATRERVQARGAAARKALSKRPKAS